MFRVSSESTVLEEKERRFLQKRILKFGIPYLDKSLRGIFANDLILIGAPSGVGKTQFCVNMALANIEGERKVHFLALEASLFEVEQRIKYSLIQRQYYSDPDREKIGRPLTFESWIAGDFDSFVEPYEKWATQYMAKAFSSLFVGYKVGDFTAQNMTEQILRIQDETDLVIIDHVHYFDFDGDNENRAIKDIAKTARTLSLECSKPIVLVSHLRKRDRGNKELVAGMEEFHGSSDLFKIATKVITLAPGRPVDKGRYETFIRVAKNRMNSSPTRYVGKVIYNENSGTYEEQFKLTWSNSEKFEEIDATQLPWWATFREDRNDGSKVVSRVVRNHTEVFDR